MRDTANMIKQGVPSVVLVHEPFNTLANVQMKQLGIEDTTSHVLPYPVDRLATDPPDFVRKKAREQAGKLPGLLTSQQWPPKEE